MTDKDSAIIREEHAKRDEKYQRLVEAAGAFLGVEWMASVDWGPREDWDKKINALRTALSDCKPKMCEWRAIAKNIYFNRSETSCGKVLVPSMMSGAGPLIFCPYCGGKIKVKGE